MRVRVTFDGKPRTQCRIPVARSKLRLLVVGFTPSMLRRPVCVSTSTPMTPSHGLVSQRLKKSQRIISGWQAEVMKGCKAEICVCRASSVIPDTFLQAVRGSATVNGLTRGSGEDQKTNSEPSPYTRPNFEADFLCAGTRLQTYSRLGHALGFQ